VPGAAERFPSAESVIVKTMKPVRDHHLGPAACWAGRMSDSLAIRE
jgi:hypothetical protein